MSENSSNPINTTKLPELNQLLEKGIIDQETFDKEKILILKPMLILKPKEEQKGGFIFFGILFFIIIFFMISTIAKGNEWIFATGAFGLVSGIVIFGVPILIFLVSILVIKTIFKK